MADGCVNWFVRGYAMLGLGLDSNSSVLKTMDSQPYSGSRDSVKRGLAV